MNPLATLTQLLTIKDKTPIAVYYSYIEPLEHPLPIEVAKDYFKDAKKDLLTAFVGLENYSTKVLKDIRIKLKSPLEFSPKLESNEKGRVVEFTFDEESLEISIKRLDPEESVYLSLFPLRSSLAKDFEPQVIIEDELLTRGMKRMGYYKKNPLFLLVYSFSVVIVVMLFGQVFWGAEAIEYERRIDPDDILIQEAQERIKGLSCSPSVIEVKSDIDWYIKQSPMQPIYLLEANGVKTYDELLRLKKAVICLPNTANK